MELNSITDIKCEVVIYFASNPSRLHFDSKDNLKLLPEHLLNDISKENFHLYIISDDEIRDNDWAYEVNEAYPTGLPQILKCVKRVIDFHGNSMITHGGWRRVVNMPATGVEMKKIIATTDPDLHKDNVPKIPTLFINDMCNFVNKDMLYSHKYHKLADVFVEYYNITKCICFGYGSIGCNYDNNINNPVRIMDSCLKKLRHDLKTDKNNFITLKLI